MEPLAPPSKKTRPDPFLTNGTYAAFSLPPSSAAAVDKRFAPPSEAFSSDGSSVGSKSKACLKFFSTSGCPYGEGCHFAHYIPGGMASLAFPQASSLAAGLRKDPLAQIRLPKPVNPYGGQGFAPSGFKSRLCSNFGTPEGCRFGEKCHFAHGEQELKKVIKGASDVGAKVHDRSQVHLGPSDDKLPFGRHPEPTPPGLAAAGLFGAMSTAKVSIDASLAGLIIGKGGVIAKAITRATGARICIRDHETDANLKNVEMEGSLDQIKYASGMVRELLAHKDLVPSKPGGLGSHTYKSKLCENFPKGSCTYGERCHFAHGQAELQQHAPF